MNEETTHYPILYDAPQNRSGKVTLRELTARLFFRFKLFIACAFIVPVVSLYLIHIIPVTYEASAKVLVGYDESVSPFFKEIAVAKRQMVSGQSNAELLKSLPVCYRVVEALDIQSSDIEKPAYKVLLSHFMGPLFRLFEKDSEKSAVSETEAKMHLAGEFQDSVSPKIVLKGRNEVRINDELIDVSLRSFNHDKVAAMTNRLCNEFIDEYYRLYTEEAARAHEYLTQQIRKIETEIFNNNFEKMKNHPTPNHAVHTQNDGGGKWSERNVNADPIIDTLSRQIADLELKLTRLEATFPSDAPEVIKAQTELTAARKRLDIHKAKESAESVLNILKEKQQQADMSLQIYKNRLISIALVEKAVTPKKSATMLILRYVMVGGFGLFAGIAMGIVMVMFFSAIDNRIYTPWDIDGTKGHSVIGSIPETNGMDPTSIPNMELPIREAAGAVMGALGRLDLSGTGKGIILAVSSPSKGEGKTFTVLQIAHAIAHDKRVKVLVVDANFLNPKLSERMGQSENEANQQKGMTDFLRGEEKIKDLIVGTDINNLFLIPSGSNKKRLSLGFYKKSLQAAFEDIRREYDLIIVDTPGLLVSTDAAMFVSESDKVMLVVKAGITRKEILMQSKLIITETGTDFLGAIMNFRKYPIPKIFYGQGSA